MRLLLLVPLDINGQALVLKNYGKILDSNLAISGSENGLYLLKMATVDILIGNIMINHWIFEFSHVFPMFFPSFSDKPLRPSVHLQLMRMPGTLGKEIFGSISIANDISNLLPWTNLRDAVGKVNTLPADVLSGRDMLTPRDEPQGDLTSPTCQTVAVPCCTMLYRGS